MHVRLLQITVAIVAYITATAQPLVDIDTKPSLHSRPAPQTYSCTGSGMCNRQMSRSLSWACNSALGKIDASATYKTGGQARHTGVCVNMPSEAFGCGIFVSGPKGCARTGAQMIQAVSDIRTRGKCVICGWVMEDEDSSDGDGCKVKIDYVSGC